MQPIPCNVKKRSHTQKKSHRVNGPLYVNHIYSNNITNDCKRHLPCESYCLGSSSKGAECGVWWLLSNVPEIRIILMFCSEVACANIQEELSKKKAEWVVVKGLFTMDHCENGSETFCRVAIFLYRSTAPLHLRMCTREGVHVLPYIKCTTIRTRVTNKSCFTLTQLRVLQCLWYYIYCQSVWAC